jgi:predicted transcriptional regulator
MTNQNIILIKQLRKVGLKQNESEVYLWLLENGISTPPIIAKGTSIARTNCYNILESLLQKDVVNEQFKGKKKAYTARDPKSLKLNLEKKIESINHLLPDLEALHKTQKNKPIFKFYDGFSEVKGIYESSLESIEIYALGSTKQLDAIDPVFFNKYIEQCHERNIRYHDILTADSQKTADFMLKMRGNMHTVTFLPPEYSDIMTDMLIWNDNIALISLEEPIFGTVIQSKPLATTLKNIFRLISSKK